jgi:hypothetical protein
MAHGIVVSSIISDQSPPLAERGNGGQNLVQALSTIAFFSNFLIAA